MNRLQGIAVLGLVGIVLTGGVCGCTKPQGKKLEAGGSSFVNPMMQLWTREYEAKGVSINYQGTAGSGAGVKKMISKEFDFGCTDAYMNEEQISDANKSGGEAIHIPLVMGGVVPAYHLPGVTQSLKFTGQVLADIFLGKIKKWNDPALLDINPDYPLPDMAINVVTRSDTSGTTSIFTDYLSKVSPEWKKEVGAATSVTFKVGVGQKGSEGVAGQIERTPGSIGYIELIYASGKKNVGFGSVRNKAGKFVEASLESVTAAAKGALTSIPPDLRYSLTDAEGEDAYPIAGTTWAVLYVKQPADKKDAVVGFLRWVTHEGQEKAQELKYSRLPEGLVKLIDQKLAQVHD
jgi:phosphate transport system substrate-binding protein